MLSYMVKKRVIANRFRALGVLAALVTVGLFASPALAGATSSAKTVSFSATYSGKASLLIVNSKVKISSITGSGKNSLFGTSKVSGSGAAAASAQCDPFGGKGNIAGGSSKITFTVTESSAQQGCSNGESGPITVTFHGTAKATGGGGKANGASGTLKFSGTLHLGGTSGSQSGTFKVSLSGKLTVKS
jgi:hypothetical protein